jgi:hypothetical protein
MALKTQHFQMAATRKLILGAALTLLVLPPYLEKAGLVVLMAPEPLVAVVHLLETAAATVGVAALPMRLIVPVVRAVAEQEGTLVLAVPGVLPVLIASLLTHWLVLEPLEAAVVEVVEAEELLQITSTSVHQ